MVRKGVKNEKVLYVADGTVSAFYLIVCDGVTL